MSWAKSVHIRSFYFFIVCLKKQTFFKFVVLFIHCEALDFTVLYFIWVIQINWLDFGWTRNPFFFFFFFAEAQKDRHRSSLGDNNIPGVLWHDQSLMRWYIDKALRCLQGNVPHGLKVETACQKSIRTRSPQLVIILIAVHVKLLPHDIKNIFISKISKLAAS